MISRTRIDPRVRELMSQIDDDLPYTTLAYIRTKVNLEYNRLRDLMYQMTIPQTVQDRIYNEKLPELKSALEKIENILSGHVTNFSISGLTSRLKKITH